MGSTTTPSSGHRASGLTTLGKSPTTFYVRQPRLVLTLILYRTTEISQSFFANRVYSDVCNCAIHAINIHEDATNEEVLGAIWEGGIQKYNRLPAVKGLHVSSGASFSFKIPEAARDILIRSRNEGVCIRGSRMVAMENRDKRKPMQPSIMHQIRFLHVIGPNETLNAEKLKNILHTLITFDLVKRWEWAEDEG
ncbi:hypothetical protein BDZ45DRAFT_738457 [Acephala macrosclerotiorum]|nr:hypothetical protein BDZ45DRAFT_738457 [Acephala macrosclerotiorum]